MTLPAFFSHGFRVALLIALTSIPGRAQTVFWSETFDAPAGGPSNNNAGAGWSSSVATPGGGPNGSFFGISNQWVIGTANGACVSGTKLYIRATGNNNNYLSDVTTDRMISTPNISTEGTADISLQFTWRCDGVPNQDYGLVGLSSNGGTSWNWLPARYYGQETCTSASITIPVTYEGIANFKIAFRFISNATSCSTCDPPFNIDNIELQGTTTPCSTPAPSSIQHID